MTVTTHYVAPPDLASLCERMLRTRPLEDTVLWLFLNNEIDGPTLLYQGQEDVAVGVCDVLDEGGPVAATYRGHGAALGLDQTALLAQLLDRETGTNGGRLVGPANAAADELAGQGIEPDVVGLRSLRPLGVDTIAESAGETKRLVAVEEGPPISGYGTEVVAGTVGPTDQIAVRRVSLPDIPMPFGGTVEDAAIPTPAGDVVGEA